VILAIHNWNYLTRWQERTFILFYAGQQYKPLLLMLLVSFLFNLNWSSGIRFELTQLRGKLVIFLAILTVQIFVDGE